MGWYKKPASRKGFAPAFASKSQTPDDDVNEHEYEFMKEADIQTSRVWNTFDPELREASFTEP